MAQVNNKSQTLRSAREFCSSLVGQFIFVAIAAAWCSLGGGDVAVAAPNAKITWSQPRLEQFVAPGGALLVDLTFTSSRNVDDITIEIVPELQPYVTVTPSYIASVQKNVAQSVQIVTTAPQGNLSKFLHGTVHVKQGNATLAKPLPIEFTVDASVPHVHIDSPANGATLFDSPITVTGKINDLVVGTVNAGEIDLTVNGLTAALGNGTFLVDALPLTEGENTITAIAVDRAGNQASHEIAVTLATPAGARISLVSGNNQTGEIGMQLTEPLVVQLIGSALEPADGRTVVFRVRQGDGLLDGTQRAVAATTDADGFAEALFSVGMRAGLGNHRVEAKAVGFAGAAVFSSSATTADVAQILIDSGNAQRGVVGDRLPDSLVAIITDVGNNRLSDISVTFTVTLGGGNLGGETSVEVLTDANGRAVTELTVGPEEGIYNNIVQADFPGNVGYPASFVASGRIAGDSALTKISGVVLDNTDQPIPGVTIEIKDTAFTALTDDEGQFDIQAAPTGDLHLIANGTTTARAGTWPTLEFELFSIAGQNNTIGMPIYLLPLDVANGLQVDETTGGTITVPDVPGFALEIAPGSATFPDGSNSGLISVTTVHADKVPMTPNFGQQPRLVVTIQPPGVLFDPPAPLTLPNVDGLAPGEVTEFYSFDHDLGQFVTIGTGSVSNDGTVIVSDPGTGIIKGGWNCGGNPSSTGSAGTCAECEECQEDECVEVPDLWLVKNDDPHDCNETVCIDGREIYVPNELRNAITEVPREALSDTRDNCVQYVCNQGLANEIPDNTDTPSVPNSFCCGAQIVGIPPNYPLCGCVGDDGFGIPLCCALENSNDCIVL